MTMFMLPTSASSAPKVPPGDSPYGCFMGNDYYHHGALYHFKVYFNRTLLYHDVLKCLNGSWVYQYSVYPPEP